MKNIDIIILHFGDITVTQQCIKSIEAKAKGYRNIILINNDVTIDLTKHIKKQKKRIIINSEKNHGFAAGVNIGIKKALHNKADFVCLLNNDVTIKKDFVQPIVTFMSKQENAGIAGSIIEFALNGMSMFDHGAYVSNTTGKGTHSNNASIKFKKPQLVDYVSGCCMMIKKEVFDTIGYFDERFFMYYEDVDFCLRANQKGFMTYVIPSAIVQHALSRAIGRKSKNLTYMLVKSDIRFSKKHSEFPLRFIATFSQIAKFAIKMPSHIPVILKAVKEA